MLDGRFSNSLAPHAVPSPHNCPSLRGRRAIEKVFSPKPTLHIAPRTEIGGNNEMTSFPSPNRMPASKKDHTERDGGYLRVGYLRPKIGKKEGTPDNSIIFWAVSPSRPLPIASKMGCWPSSFYVVKERGLCCPIFKTNLFSSVA